jgi:tetratricopeptide (TPR) repeat protein
MIALLLVLALATPESDVKRARDRYEFGAYADAAGAARDVLSRNPTLPQPVAVEAWRILGLAQYQLGDLPAAREAFIHLLSVDPDQTLDPFLVPTPSPSSRPYGSGSGNWRSRSGWPTRPVVACSSRSRSAPARPPRSSWWRSTSTC